jgi:AcrR family transcriptional regulator
MSPRPRTVPDADILLAAQKAMARRGPARLTLADVARDAGLSPATLVQRFGSKRGLMLALWASALDGVDACFAMLRPAHPSPLEAALAGATEMARDTTSPEEFSNHLAFLQIDLSDPEFHGYMLEMSRKMEAGYVALLDEAVRAGELARCDTTALARAINAMAGGSLISWAVFRAGTAEAWVRRDLETLVRPYRAGRGRRLRLRRRKKKKTKKKTTSSTTAAKTGTR